MSKQPIRILIVDDCPEDRELYKRFLQRDRQRRYRVSEAETGRQGWELIIREQPHCILLDYRLPDLDGLQILHQLNAHATEMEVPAVVLLTSHGSERLAAAALRGGAFDYLAKATLTGEQLLSTIRRVVAQAKNSLRSKRNHEKTRRELEDKLQKLQAAGEIQRNMLPKEAPRIAGFEIGAGCLPAEATGGDFYDFLTLRDGMLGLAMGDVVGHGLGPALLASETRAYLRAFSRSMSGPGAVLVATNQLLFEDTCGNRFVTLFFAVVDPKSRVMRFSGAGHRAYLLRSEEVIRIDSHQPPLGIAPNAVEGYERELLLQSGDLFLLMTDGITESIRPDPNLSWTERVFGEARVVDYLQNNRSKPASEMVAGLFEEVHRHTGQSTHEDDMTLMVVKVLDDERLRSPGPR
jgi:phosphoserine phosphatase RsbU/P